MTNQLRETLYFGDADCSQYLTEAEYEQLVALHDKITTGRLNDNKMAMFGVFVHEGHAVGAGCRHDAGPAIWGQRLTQIIIAVTCGCAFQWGLLGF